jgi:lipopolysaccharide transport system ATP-binding protein
LFIGTGDNLSDVFWALKDVSFDVRQGEVVGIIGRNGAGKSTLLKILSRITEPTNGEADVYGRVGSLLEVGTGFHPELSGRENIYLNGAILGMKRREIDGRFDEIVEFAEIERFIDTAVKHYSSGMYLRLAFAVAAHLEPEILVVDEVLAVGDAAFQRKCLGKMKDVARGNRTVLFVSHNMAAIENLCERTILIEGGTIAADGPSREVIERYIGSLVQDSDQPLLERTDRRGLGRITVTDIEFRDENGRRLESAVTGQRVLIRVHYRNWDDVQLRNGKITLLVKRNEQTYFILSSALCREEPLELARSGHVDFCIPELPLVQGLYYLGIVIQTGPDYQDAVDCACTLPVQDGDFFGTGHLYPAPGWQAIGTLIKHSCFAGTEAACEPSAQL